MKKSDLREQSLAWVLLSPALLVLAAFGLFPIGYALYVSLHEWQIRQGGFIGLEHYVRALGEPRSVGLAIAGVLLLGLAAWLRRRWHGPQPVLVALVLLGAGVVAAGLAAAVDSGDPRLYNGFKVTLFYVLGTVPLELGLSMGLAYLLFQSLRAKGFFRVVFFLPYVTPVIASAVVFRTIFSPHPASVANRFWQLWGLEGQRWLHESRSVVGLALDAVGATGYPAWVDQVFPSLALVSIVLYNIWVYVGYDTVILLAGLSAIPGHYYEAAAIDGATSWQGFRHVTLPLISPTLFFLSMVGVIGTFKAFNHIFMMRTPGARDTVDVVSVVVFDQLFQYHDAGYAATLAFVLFLAILSLTLLQNRVLGRRVFYGD
jgi:multiple sugar transport system permease protein